METTSRRHEQRVQNLATHEAREADLQEMRASIDEVREILSGLSNRTVEQTH